jgi:hypothetical protein
MKRLQSLLLTTSTSALISCGQVPNLPENSPVGSICDQVHDNVMAMHFALPERGKEQAQLEKTKCQTLTYEEQQSLLEDSRIALQVTGSRALMGH